MSSTGTFGINSDNFNISGNTNINNLVVSGTTSFPANSISSTSISGGTGGLTLSSDATDATRYITFSSSATGDISTANTSSNLYYNPYKTLFYSLGYGFVANYYQAQSFSATLAIGNNITSGSINIGNISTMSGTITIGSSLSNVNIAGTISGTISNATNATNATQIYQNYDNTTTTEVYALLFSPKSASSGNNTVYQGPIFYTPNTNLINANVANATTATTSTNANITGNNTQASTFYIPFVNNSNGSGGFPLKTASALSFVPSTGALSCGPLTTTGTITLPTSATPYNATTGTGTNNLGQVISGTIASNVLSTTSATLSTISLNAGVWMIVGSINATIAAAGTIQICINTSNTATLNKNISATGYAQSLNVSASVSTILSLTAATATPINLNGNSSVAPTASSTVGQFYAVRIA